MKHKIIATSIVLLTALGVMTIAPRPKELPQSPSSLVSKSATIKETPPETKPIITETTPVTSQSNPASIPTSTEPASTPAYGEDPNNPGVFIVFDKTAVMNEAGVSLDEQSAASQLISLRMNWRYKVAGFPDANLCYAAPIAKMQSAGDDYIDNPVTQLKWCNTYVKARYGGWQQALDFFNQNQYF